MKTEDAIATLRRYESALRARGVRHAALFGSVARGDNRPGSDIDIMVEMDPAAHITVFDYVGLKEYIASLFDGPVDVVSREGLNPTFDLRRRPTRSMPSDSADTALRDMLHHIDLATRFVAVSNMPRFATMRAPFTPLPGVLRSFPKHRGGCPMS